MEDSSTKQLFDLVRETDKRIGEVLARITGLESTVSHHHCLLKKIQVKVDGFFSFGSKTLVQIILQLIPWAVVGFTIYIL